MKHKSAIQNALLGWFNRRRRDMPWRRTTDPYAIWVSEIMLQQTQVDTVKPYFQRFLKQFPTVNTLADARLDTVLKAWEGLGYYTRARNLHQAAKHVVADFAGWLPADPRELRRLPGIGPYTAGAIASIAFGRDEPVLDGNVTRVVCRVFRIRDNPTTSSVRNRLWSLARDLIPPGKASPFNQALMDLGSTLCAPRNPQCLRCPIQTHCQAFARSEQDALPNKPKRRPTPHYDVVAAVIVKRGWILIDQRPPDGLLGGLWEFPGGKVKPRETREHALVRELREELDIDIEIVRPLVTVRHAYSHFRITLHAFECNHLARRPRPIACAACKWIRRRQLSQYPFPKANHKIISALQRTE